MTLLFYKNFLIDHLLESCQRTLNYRNVHDLSSHTLVDDSLATILKIAEFDAWTWEYVEFDSVPSNCKIQDSLTDFKKRKNEDI